MNKSITKSVFNEWASVPVFDHPEFGEKEPKVSNAFKAKLIADANEALAHEQLRGLNPSGLSLATDEAFTDAMLWQLAWAVLFLQHSGIKSLKSFPKPLRRVGSYGLKHLMERWASSYVSNGIAILACEIQNVLWKREGTVNAVVVLSVCPMFEKGAGQILINGTL